MGVDARFRSPDRLASSDSSYCRWMGCLSVQKDVKAGNLAELIGKWRHLMRLVCRQLYKDSDKAHELWRRIDERVTEIAMGED
jgi:hypothetical protein